MQTKTGTSPRASDYDTVSYPSGLYSQTHPDRLATVARLFGLDSPPVDHARILELGCGDGLNLISLAHILPEASLTGVDIAAQPIARGQSTIESLGLKNVRLLQADVLELEDSLGPFDYILAHGLYSWVPAPVRQAVLRLCQTSLSATGVAYLSYNAYPGNHFRDLARGLMHYHIRQFDDAATQVSQARSVLKFITGSQPDPDLYRLVLEKQLDRVVSYNDSAFYHDDLSPDNQPFYFYQVIEAAESHGLQYLGEADYGDMREDSYLPKTEAALRQLGGNLVAREQYLDFLRNRAFRQTLLCRADCRLDRSSPASRVSSLYAAANLEPQESTPSGRAYFPGPKGGLETSHPVDQWVLNYLGSHWPQAFAVTDLVRLAEEAFSEKGDTVSALHIATLLLLGYESGPITLHTLPPPCTARISARPRASSLARALSARGSSAVPTLRHQIVRLEDPIGQRLLALLDGSHTLEDIVEELLVFTREMAAGPPPGAKDRQRLQLQLTENLESLARTAIMEA